ncbi:MAG: hypothetical protein ACREDE_06760 [Thermoplasmata archaeon]
MTNPEEAVRCPECRELVSVEPDWRLVICPHCGGVITRMTGDASYD